MKITINVKSILDKIDNAISTIASRKGKNVAPVKDFYAEGGVAYALSTPISKIIEYDDGTVAEMYEYRWLHKSAIVREQASLSGPKLNDGNPLPVGTKVLVLRVSGSFAEIYYTHSAGSKSATGWILREYLGTEPPETSKGLSAYDSTAASASSSSQSASIDNSWSQAKLGSIDSTYIPVMNPSVSTDESEFISSKEQYEEPFNLFIIPGYKPARMTIFTNVNGRLVSRSFEFLIGPTDMSESNANSLVPIKTGAGHFISRNGADLGRLILRGFLLDSKSVDERRLFMENYYRSYLIDKYSAFHSYFNESTLVIEIEGYRYQCILQNLDLSKSSNSMFLYAYAMSLLIINQEPIGNIREPSSSRIAAESAVYFTESVYNVANVLTKATTLYLLGRIVKWPLF